MNFGSIAGLACIRGGHSIGANRHVDIAQASDEHCGRIVVGLPEHNPKIAVSYTDFVALDANQSVNGGISEEEHLQRQARVDSKVRHAFQRLEKFHRIRLLLKIELASHLIHREAYGQLI